MKEDPVPYTTDYLPLAAFLILRGFPCLSVIPRSARAAFTFAPEAERATQDFWTKGKDLVPARYFHAVCGDLIWMSKGVVKSGTVLYGPALRSQE